MLTKLKNSNCDKTLKLKLGQKLKTHILTQLKNSNLDKTQFLIKLKVFWSEQLDTSTTDEMYCGQPFAI